MEVSQMTREGKLAAINWLKNFKQDYNWNNKQIAQHLQTTEATVSNWLNGHALPQDQYARGIINLIEENSIPGIIRIPKNQHWNDSLFVRVQDVKNPYVSYYDDDQIGEDHETFMQWMQEWQQEFPNPTIYRQYTSYQDPYWMLHSRHHVLQLNSTIAFKDCFIGQPSIEAAFRKYKGLDPTGLDLPLIEKLISGEDDGTT